MRPKMVIATGNCSRGNELFVIVSKVFLADHAPDEEEVLRQTIANWPLSEGFVRHCVRIHEVEWDDSVDISVTIHQRREP